MSLPIRCELLVTNYFLKGLEFVVFSIKYIIHNASERWLFLDNSRLACIILEIKYKIINGLKSFRIIISNVSSKARWPCLRRSECKRRKNLLIIEYMICAIYGNISKYKSSCVHFALQISRWSLVVLFS